MQRPLARVGPGSVAFSWAFGFAIVIVAASGLGCVPVGVRHFYHLLVPPADLYEPIVIDAFFFGEAGAKRSYVLKPRYGDYYEIGLRAEGRTIPKDLRFQGQVRVDLFKGDELAESLDLTEMRTRYHAKNGEQGYARVAFASFALPLSPCSDATTRMQVTVVDPVVIDATLANSLQFYVGVAATP